MSFLNTSLPYKDRNFIVDDSDKELFIMMKSIIDSGFPEATQPMMLELYKLCWQKKKRIEYKEIGPSTIFIHFPRMNIFSRIIGRILLLFASDKEE